MKEIFYNQLSNYIADFSKQVCTEDGQWTVKGFIDVFKNIYLLSTDTKLISKIFEIHLLPRLIKFAQQNHYKIVLAEQQNYYPDISFISMQNEKIRFAVDIKTTYRNLNKPHLCNGFTLGSHGEYFSNRNSTKNIQFPYSSYLGHFCLGIIYDRVINTEENAVYQMNDLHNLPSVIKNLSFFVKEKWKIASDKSGSGNTANIGSITNISDIMSGQGMFAKLGEHWFDDYWMNYKKITITNSDGNTKKISNLKEFVTYRKGDISLILNKRS